MGTETKWNTTFKKILRLRSSTWPDYCSVLQQLFLFCLRDLDMKSTYMRNRPIKRQINVRPSAEVGAKRDTLWLLKKPPYGITAVERQSAKFIAEGFLDSAGHEWIMGWRQLYIMRESYSVDGFIAKITDDLIITNSTLSINLLAANLWDWCPVIKIVSDENTSSNGGRISQHERGNSYMSMR